MGSAAMGLYTVCPEPECGMVLFVDKREVLVACPGCRVIYAAEKLREAFQRQLDEGPLLGEVVKPRTMGDLVNDRQ